MPSLVKQRQKVTLEVLPVLRMRGGGGEVVPAVQDGLLAERGEALPVGRHPGLGPSHHPAHGAAAENKECMLLGNPVCTFFAHSTTILVSSAISYKNNQIADDESKFNSWSLARSGVIRTTVFILTQ